MRHYLLSLYQPGTRPPAPEALEKIMADVGALRTQLQAEGSWVFGDGLHEPGAATVVRPEGDETVTVDGPFTESKEHIGGLVIIRVADLDAALAWGRRYANATTLPIEVRPFQTEAED
jgi:hypothetical protein